MKAGQHVTPTLKLTRLLGKGGMGSVWLADHLTLGTQVAIKFMSIANLEDETLLQRFSTEAKAAAQIKHPHVAQVFDHGVMPDGVPYIVMEYLEGEDLKHAVRRAGPLPIPDVARVVSQAAKALARAHSLGIVHRDIKPDNIFLCNIDSEMFVKLLDFGVAKVETGTAMGATTTGSMMGTPLYMSPEQLLSARTVSFRSDLWSLAVVAYFALTGRVPFTGETIGSLSVAVHAGVFAPPSTLRPELPPAIDAWFVRMLKRDPNERYGSAKEMAEAFEQAVAMRAPLPSSAVVSTPPTSTPQLLSTSTPSAPSYPAVLSQSAPASHDPSGLINLAQPTFSGTSSDAGRRQGATKKQLLVAVGASAGAMLLLGLIAFLTFGSKGQENKPQPAAQPERPSAQPVTPVGAPTIAHVAAENSATATSTTPPHADKPPADKPTTKTSTASTSSTSKTGTTKPAPPAGPITKPPVKDTIGF